MAVGWDVVGCDWFDKKVIALKNGRVLENMKTQVFARVFVSQKF